MSYFATIDKVLSRDLELELLTTTDWRIYSRAGIVGQNGCEAG